jgi:hypothetical protein
VQVKGTIFFFWFGYGFLVLKGLGHLFNGWFLVLSNANLNELWDKEGKVKHPPK